MNIHGEWRLNINQDSALCAAAVSLSKFLIRSAEFVFVLSTFRLSRKCKLARYEDTEVDTKDIQANENCKTCWNLLIKSKLKDTIVSLNCSKSYLYF